MPDEKKVVIPVSRYISLIQAEELLSALQGGGVDNWEWYDESIDRREEKTDEEILKGVEYAS